MQEIQRKNCIFMHFCTFISHFNMSMSVSAVVFKCSAVALCFIFFHAPFDHLYHFIFGMRLCLVLFTLSLYLFPSACIFSPYPCRAQLLYWFCFFCVNFPGCYLVVSFFFLRLLARNLISVHQSHFVHFPE